MLRIVLCTIGVIGMITAIEAGGRRHAAEIANLVLVNRIRQVEITQRTHFLGKLRVGLQFLHILVREHYYKIVAGKAVVFVHPRRVVYPVATAIEFKLRMPRIAGDVHHLPFERYEIAVGGGIVCHLIAFVFAPSIHRAIHIECVLVGVGREITGSHRIEEGNSGVGCVLHKAAFLLCFGGGKRESANRCDGKHHG